MTAPTVHLCPMKNLALLPEMMTLSAN